MKLKMHNLIVIFTRKKLWEMFLHNGAFQILQVF